MFTGDYRIFTLLFTRILLGFTGLPGFTMIYQENHRDSFTGIYRGFTGILPGPYQMQVSDRCPSLRSKKGKEEELIV